jgi:DNA-binding transcriptional LysR family regulator
MLINLELYRIFYITAKSGSISRAAKELFTSQPALSQSIKLLEKKLGGELFFRNARGVSLTAEGEVLFQYIEQGYRLIMAGEQKFSELKNMQSGQLRLAVCTAVCKNNLMAYITQYNQCYPEIRLQIRDESSQEIARMLDLGEVDIGIINLKNTETSGFSIVKTLEMQSCFVVGSVFKSSFVSPLSIRDLWKTYPLIALQKGGTTRESMDELFFSHGINLSPQFELENLDLIVEFAKSGLGAAYVIRDYVKEELKKGLLYEIPIYEDIPVRKLGILVKKDMPLSTASLSFLSLIS